VAGDPYYNSVSLLLHGDSTFVDSGPLSKTVTVTNAVISTTQKMFSSAGSMYFDGAGDYLTLDGSSVFAFGAGDFTAEMFVWLTSAAATYALFDFRPSGVNGAYPLLYVDAGNIVYYANTSALITAAHGISSGSWVHVALCKSGGSTKVFVEGAQKGSTYADSITYLNGANRPVFGVGGYSLGTTPFNGYMDELRITKGVARYPSAFTPPTAAHPNSLPIVSGIVRDSSNALCARTVRAYDRTTGAFVASTTSNGTTGAYTLNCTTLNEVSVICLDDVAGTTENDLVLRTTPV